MFNSLPDSTTPTLPSIDALRRSLVADGIEITAWGTGDAKSLESLWKELTAGEIHLQGSPLCRVLSGVVQVIIRREDGCLLVEESQTFKDGRVRSRNLPPSEKMLPGEDYLDAARRCLWEELALPRDTFTLLPETYQRQETTRTSWSYPGLMSKYVIHRVEARLQPAALPLDDFTTQETDNTSDDIATHLWSWQREHAGID